MGNGKRGWFKATFIFIVVIAFLFAGILVTNYFWAKASSGPADHPKVAHAEEAANGSLTDLKNKKFTKDLGQYQNPDTIVWVNQNDKHNEAGNTTENQAVGQPVNLVNGIPQDLPNTEAPPANGAKVIYLTFDDGPAPFSGDIIALLEKHHFKATFFMLAPHILQFPESAKLMVQYGEGVGLHGVTHDVHKFYASANSVVGEMTQDQKTLQEVTGVQTFLIRPPYGSVPYMTPEYRKAVDDHHFLMWDWNIDSKDWYYKDGRYVTNVIQQLSKMAHHNGPIVILMHEQKQTLAYLPEMLDYLSKQGYESRALDQSMPAMHFSYHKKNKK